MSKYEPLREHLARLDDVVWAAKLDEVEKILGSNLPKSAREHRTWWANSGGTLVHQNAWLDAGWKVDRTDLPRNVIVFRRLRIGGTALASHGRAGRPVAAAEAPLKAAEKKLAGEMPALRQPVTVTLRAEWTALGSVQKLPCSSTGIPMTPGILRLTSLDESEARTVIVAAKCVQELYSRIRQDLRAAGENGRPAPKGNAFGKLGLDPRSPIECDVVKPGNAWLLTDGRGRKADLEDSLECALVAQLLYLQETQAGRKSHFTVL